MLGERVRFGANDSELQIDEAVANDNEHDNKHRQTALPGKIFLEFSKIPDKYEP